jgi:hypothetical protein
MVSTTNCLGDHAGDQARQFLQVEVPKAHPLFNLEGDDSLDIPEYLDMAWVVKSYGGKCGSSRTQDAEEQHLAINPLVRLLLLQAQKGDEEWGEVSQRRLAHARGSVLVVDRAKHDLRVDVVQAMCKMIEQVVVPLIAENRKSGEAGRRKVLEGITVERFERFLAGK